VPTAIGLIAVLVASVWFTPWGFVALVCLVLALALRELTSALSQAGFRVPFVPLAVGAVATQVAAANSGASGVVVGIFLTLAAAALWRALDFDYRARGADAPQTPHGQVGPPAANENRPHHGRVGFEAQAADASVGGGGAWTASSAAAPVDDAVQASPAPARRPVAQDIYATAFATLYLPTLAALVVLLSFMEQGRWLILVLVAIPVASDTGGYFTGYHLGKHKLAPNVSPAKTWEGLAGSVALAAAAGIGGMALMGRPWHFGLALGVAGSLAATLGDLAESLLKRSLGIKDMGSLLPGHGGVLDRVDSILMTAPFAYVLITLVGAGVFG
jgi:phosphatidate cytidylyltransferase